MAILKKRAKVLLYGNVAGAYRSENLIKLLLDSGYHISLISPDFYCQRGAKNAFLARFIQKFLGKLYLVDLFIKAAISDILYLLPINSDSIQSAVWASRLFGAKLIVEPYESLYDTHVKDKKTIPENSRAANKIKNKDTLVLTKSDYVIHLSHSEISHWETLLDISIDRNKLFVAPLFCEPSLTSKRSFMQDGVLKICWWGTFIPLHGLDNILQALKLLKAKELPFICELFGPSTSGYAQRFAECADTIKTYGLESHVFLRKDLKFADYSLPNYLAENCDLALGIFGTTGKALNAVPNKLIEALALGIPCLTMNSPALAEFFEPSTDFWTCEPMPESIAEAVIAIASGTATPVDWQRSREKVLETFSVKRYQEVVLKVLSLAENELNAKHSATRIR